MINKQHFFKIIQNVAVLNNNTISKNFIYSGVAKCQNHSSNSKFLSSYFLQFISSIRMIRRKAFNFSNRISITI